MPTNRNWLDRRRRRRCRCCCCCCCCCSCCCSWWGDWGCSIAGSIKIAEGEFFKAACLTSMAMVGRYVFVADSANQRVFRWVSGETTGREVARHVAPINGHNRFGGRFANGTCAALQICLNNEGRLLVVNRLQQNVIQFSSSDGQVMPMAEPDLKNLHAIAVPNIPTESTRKY